MIACPHMKRPTALFLLLLLSTIGLAQSFTVQQTTAYAAGDSDLTYFDAMIRVYNNVPGNNQLRWVRTQQIMPPTWRTSVCNASYCFPMSTDTAVFTMTPGDSDLVMVDFYPFNTNGSAIVTIKLYAVNDPADSVILTFYGNTTVGIEQHLPIGFSFFPNPASDELHIEGTNIRSAEIFNSFGQSLKQLSFADDHSEDISLGDLPAGCYYVRVTDEEGRTGVKKLVKK